MLKKKFHVRMKYIFKECDYIIDALDEHEALELAKKRREAEWEETLKEVAYWATIPLPHERDTDSENDE